MSSGAGFQYRLRRPARAFSELLAHAHHFDLGNPADTRRLVEHYLTLVERAPVFTLQYSPGLEQLPQLLRGVMDATAGIDVTGAPFPSELPSAVAPS